MRILFLSHRVPYPPNKGEKIRAFHQLKALAARHEVDLFTLADDPADLQHRDVLGGICREVTIAPLNPVHSKLRTLPYLLTRRPLTVPYFFSLKLKRAVSAAFARRRYDRIFLYCSAMAQYVERAWTTPIVADLVDVDSNKWKQYSQVTSMPMSWVYRREWRRLRAYEKDVCDRAARVLVTTEREAELVRELPTSAPVNVVPVGIEVGDPVIRMQESPTMIFVGDMGYFPNQQAVIWFCHQVLPKVRQAVPQARFLIVGRNPNHKVRSLGSIPGVEVTGQVPEVKPYLAQASVSVAPFLVAAGIQTKVLEAMNHGLPVVASPPIARSLLPPVANCIQTAQQPAEWAAVLIELLQNPDRAAQLGAEARKAVAETYDWRSVLTQFVQLVEAGAEA